MPDSPHLRVVVLQLGSHLAGGIGRTIVNDNEFEAFVQVGGNLEDAMHGFGERCLRVPNRKQ